MDRMLRRLWKDTKGNTLAIFAAALVPLVVVIGSGLDLSFAYMAKAKLQNACDAAALAGRQSMDGNSWTTANETEARKFFDFNFPDGTLGAQSLAFDIDQDPNDNSQIIGIASAAIPTSLMHIFGFDTIDIQANCDAKRDLGHNDVMLVLDTTGSMTNSPSIGGDTKIVRLRNGASGLYRALEDSANGSITRFGIVSYSQTVNVARSLKNRDILKEQSYNDGTFTWSECDVWWGYLYNCESDGEVYDTIADTPYIGWNGSKYGTTSFTHVGEKTVHIDDTQWASAGNTTNENRRDFRKSGDGCIEERSSIGQTVSPVTILQTVSQNDIDAVASNGNDTTYQWGRYDPESQEGQSSSACPSESQKLATYASESAFNTAIDNATANVTGYTYHDIGMLWGARFLSPTGMFSADNPTSHGVVPVNRHIVFMTDGALVTTGSTYSAYGIDNYHDRIDGTESLQDKHINRFHSICDLVKSTGTTVWVIALDVTDTDDIDDCATSSAHFYTSDGSDLEEIFENIGRGIGNLRLTR
jgi:hypothetical protein